MAKLLLLSVIVGSIALPARASRDPNPRRGLRKALIWVAAFNAFYVFSLRFLWHHL